MKQAFEDLQYKTYSQNQSSSSPKDNNFMVSSLTGKNF